MRNEDCLRPGPGGHPLHGAGARQLRRVGAARRLAGVVAVLQPVALPRHHRRARRARGGRAALPGRRLVAVGLEEPARRAEGRRPVEQDQARRRAQREELCAMATCNPADALNWGDRIGRLKAGLHGDVLVTTDRGRRPLPQPDRIDRARRAARGHQRPAVLRHHDAHEGGGRAARRADPPRAPAPLDRAHLPRRPRRRHGLAGRARRHRRRTRPTRSRATSSSRSCTATRTPRSRRCGS